MSNELKALVTGATGFIGGRLVEKLLLERKAAVRALIKDYSRASRVARFELEMIRGDISDTGAVDRAVKDCDVVFHCAHDFSNPDKNVIAARALAEACARHRIKRLVYTSSFTVYHPLPEGALDECSPTEQSGWSYAENKLEIEKYLLGAANDRGLPVTVLQPTIVYGPFSQPWTIRPVMKLRNGRVVLPADSEGLCNAVYVDDVVDALILASERDEAVGERFLISGPDVVTWDAFFRAYEQLLGTKSLVWMPGTEIERLNRTGLAKSKLLVLVRDPRRLLLSGPIRSVYKHMRRQSIGESLLGKAKEVLPPPLHVPSAVELSMYRARARVRTEKASRLLGYKPAFNFARGMDITAKYVEWANL
jgi:nucleoside-diphosphate-sugar epimerase